MTTTRWGWILTTAAGVIAAALGLETARAQEPAPSGTLVENQAETGKSDARAKEVPEPADHATDAEKTADKDNDKAEPKEEEKKPKKPPIEVATFGGGCFWSIEAIFERVPGVGSVVSGFSGGNVPSPSYQAVCTGRTGHAEVVQITFDNRVVEYETLLRLFWKAHDPTTPNRQGDDYGPQYRSIIFYHSDEQKASAWKVHDELKAKRAFRSPIVTQLYKYQSFYPAEPYHQDYFRNNPASTYSRVYIVPKIWKLKLKPR